MDTTEPPLQEEPIIYQNDPRPEMGFPPSPALEHLKYYGENESLRLEGDQIVGDIPPEMKAKYFSLTNKNCVNANLNEKEIGSLRRKAHRLKMFLRMFTPADQLTIEEINNTEQIIIDYDHRLTQGREGFGTRQRTTMTSVNLQGIMDQQQQMPKEKVRFM